MAPAGLISVNANANGSGVVYEITSAGQCLGTLVLISNGTFLPVVWGTLCLCMGDLVPRSSRDLVPLPTALKQFLM